MKEYSSIRDGIKASKNTVRSGPNTSVGTARVIPTTSRGSIYPSPTVSSSPATPSTPWPPTAPTAKRWEFGQRLGSSRETPGSSSIRARLGYSSISLVTLEPTLEESSPVGRQLMQPRDQQKTHLVPPISWSVTAPESYSTVTLLARLRGLSTFRPRALATW